MGAAGSVAADVSAAQGWGRGRPRKDTRELRKSVLRILRTGAQWADLPARYPLYQTFHRYFQEWCRDGTLKRILHALAEDLHERGGIDISEAFFDGTFAGAQKGGSAVGKTKRGKGAKVMTIADRSGLPITAGISSASPHESTLVEETIDNGFLEHAPERLIGYRAYDSNTLDDRLRMGRGNELIARHLRTRRHKAQNGRPLRRYRRRWLIRASVRVTPEPPPPGHPLGTARGEFPGLRPAGMHLYPVAAFLR